MSKRFSVVALRWSKQSPRQRHGSAFASIGRPFGIFDAFPDEAGRSAHLSGRVAAALGEKGAELLAKPPTIERVDVLAASYLSRSGTAESIVGNNVLSMT
jgi:hypothetical protein